MLSTCVRFILTLALLWSLSLVAWAQAAAARPDRGVVATNSYAVSDIERVNLTNGNLNLSIPLASLPPIAGGKLGLTLSANYNSKMWDTVRSEVQPDPLDINSRYPISQLQLTGGGWIVGARYFITYEDASFDYAWLPPAQTDPEYELLTLNRWGKIVLHTPDGATKELRPMDFSAYTDPFARHPHLRGYYKDDPNTANASLRYYSFDGSHLWVKIDPSPFLYSGIATSWTLYLPDGTKVEESAGIQRITDTNGNKIKIWVETDGAGVSTTHHQDELTGREIRAVYNPAGNGGQGQTQVQYQTVGGAWMAVTLNLGTTRIFGKTYWINDAQCPDAADFVDETITVIRSIVFPQTEPGLPGKQFTFNYNSDTVVSQNQQWRTNCFSSYITFTSASQGWGSLSRIVMPSGATVDYAYEFDGAHALTNPDDAPRESLESKTLTHDGMTDTWTYLNSPAAGGVTNPDGSHITETMYPYDRAFANTNAGFGGKEGLVFRIDNSGKTRVERHWTLKNFGGENTAPGAGVLVAFNPVVDAEYTTLMEGGQPVKMSAKTFQYDFNCNLLQETHYDWFDPALVSRDAQGVPTGVPLGAAVLRVVNHSYYNQATTSNSPNVYARRDLATVTPRILNALQQSITGPSQSQFSYDNQAYGVAPTIGNLTRVSNWDDQAGVWRNTTNGYDSFGNKISITDPRNNVTNIAFDPASHAQPTQVTVNPLNGTGAQTTTTVYDFSTGLATSVTDPNNQTTTTSYINQLLGAVDPFGRPGVVTGPPVNSVVDGVTYANQQRKVKTTYFDAARQVVVETDLNQMGDFKLKSRSSHDQLGRVIKTESNEDGAANYSISTENVYVQPGLITLTSNPKRSAAANTDGWTRATSDLLGRVIEVATFSGATPPPNTGTNSNWTGSVTTSYNANQTTVTDQAGKKRRSITDAQGRLVQVVEDPDGLAYQTDYSYDSLGNLIVVNQGGQFRYFFYDSLGRLTRAKNPEQSANSLLNLTNPPVYNNNWSTAYSYDANGNLVSKTDARNITTNYAYDALNRNTTVDYSNTTVNPDITRVFDNTNPGTNGKGRFWHNYAGGNFSTGQEVEHNAIDSYDALGRPLTKRQLFKKNSVWSAAYSVSHTYDLAGSVTSLTYPSGHIVNYSHDQAGRLSGFSGNLGGSPRAYADTIGYNAAGQMIKERFGANTSLYHNRHYNSRQQLVTTRVGDSATDAWNWSRGAFDFLYGTTAVASGNLFANDSDNNGNLRRQINYVPLAGGGYIIPQQDDYSYDALNRISSFTEAQRDSSGQWTPNVAWQNFSYDRYGNRRITGASGGVSNYNPVYDQSTNRINGLGFDAAGNIISDPLSGGPMTYDAENRLLTATSGGGGSYVYNADGKRVRRITAGQETWHVYGCGGELLAEYEANAQPNAPLKEYGYRGGQLLIIAESGSGGGVSFVKPVSKPGADLIGKAGLEAIGNADGLSVVDEPVAAPGIDEGHGSITADFSDRDKSGTLVRGGPRTTAEEYGNAPSANGIDGELLAEHPAGATPNAPQKEYGYRGGLSPITAQSGGVVTLYPSANQSPDPGQVGTLAVTGISNTGHESTLTGVNAFDTHSQLQQNNTQQRSAIWSSFQTGPPGAVSLKLKLDWTASGNVDASVEVGGSASARIDFGVSYSIDGGSSWTNALSRFRHGNQFGAGSKTDGISDSGSVEVVLSPSQNISLVKVRDFMKANATANAPSNRPGSIAESSAGITTSVSNIRLEVDTAPVISNVEAGGITASSATITWNTNENSDSQVEYGTTTAYGQSTTLDPAIVTAHSQGLSGLASGTLYHYRVKSRDAAGNLAVSGDFSFTTAPDTTPPTVASFSPAAGATNVNANANVTVTFSEAMNAATVNGATVELRDPSNALVSAIVSYNVASLTATLDPTASLTAGVTYTARVRGGGTDPRVKDVAGNALAADVTWTFITAQNGSGGIKWLVTDHLGSTRMVIDETGSLAGIKRHDYAPFGEELSAGIGIRSASLGYGDDSTRQRFGSKERDNETGLDYFLARYYSSIQGRFTSPDEFQGGPREVFILGSGAPTKQALPYADITNPQSLNKYTYSYNNPLRYTDPDGHIPAETAIDVVSFAASFYAMVTNPSWVNLGYLVWDGLATVIPYVPGSWVAKIGKYGHAGLKAAGIIGKPLDEFETVVNNKFVREGVGLLGQGDDSVRKVLGLGDDVRTADFLGVKQGGEYVIAETKGGAGLERAVQQLNNTANALVQKVGDVKFSAEIVLRKDTKIKGEFRLSGNQLERFNVKTEKWEIQKANGKAITVRFE